MRPSDSKINFIVVSSHGSADWEDQSVLAFQFEENATAEYEKQKKDNLEVFLCQVIKQ